MQKEFDQQTPFVFLREKKLIDTILLALNPIYYFWIRRQYLWRHNFYQFSFFIK